MNRYGILIFNILIIISCAREEIVITETSGIARVGDKLLFVGDDAAGCYYELSISDETAHIHPIDPVCVDEVVWPGADLVSDLEAIDQLNDGRIVVLSEELRCLFGRAMGRDGRYDVLVQYDQTVTEFGNRGLEGLAVKSLPDGNSRIAVLWEGGYPVYETLPRELRADVGRKPLRPVVIVHDLPENGSVGWMDDPLITLHLNVPEPEGRIPGAQRFRGADLVWHRWTDSTAVDGYAEGFIVLLTSENSPGPESTVPKSYRHKILQRFDLEGKAIGEPLDLYDVARRDLYAFCEAPGKHVRDAVVNHINHVCQLLDEQDWENVNWEGLDWFIEGESLVTIFDKHPMDPPFALIVDIPEEWK